jgi:hypothetical protein
MRSDEATEPLLSGCLIARDAGPGMAVCLASLRDLVDEVVVHDTGSVDATVSESRRAGAWVVEGVWDDDFGAARNVALDHAHGRWVLSVDADETVRADAPALRDWLSTAPDLAFLVRVENLVTDEGAGYDYTTVKLFRREGARWRGRVHERVEHLDLGSHELRVVPPELLVLEHSGYADAAALRRKGERNLRLADLELKDVIRTVGVTPGEVAVAALNVGRSSIGAGHRQRAVDAFEAVRELVGSGPVWNEATDYLARVLLGAGEAQLALVLGEQLRRAGVSRDYCRWLTAQGLAQAGDPAGALVQLEGLDDIVDPSGRRFDPAPREELRSLCRELLAAG